MGHSVTAHGNAQIDTAQSKYGGASAFFDGDGDYLTVAYSDDWDFGSGDFTIDGWVRFTAIDVYQGIVSQHVDGMNSWYLGISAMNRLEIYFKDTTIKGSFYQTSALPGLAINTWYHIAVARSSSTCYMFINGVSQPVFQATAFGTIGSIAANLEVGRAEGGNCFNGYIDEFRISKGIARWTADFTPPTGPCIIY